MNEAQLTVVGYVASTPTLIVTKAGRFVANMRVGVTPRRQDKDTGQWSDGDTSYVTVTCWRSLASNVAACLRKGDPIVVKGRMRVRQFDDKDGNQRTVVEVEASTLGHDLTRGVAHFLRTKRSPGEAPALQLARQMGAGNPGAAGDDRFEAGGHSANGWEGLSADDQPGAGATEQTPGESAGDPQRADPPDDGFAAADLFDDAGIEASSGGPVTGSEGDGEAEDQGGSVPDQDGTDGQQVGRAA